MVPLCASAVGSPSDPSPPGPNTDQDLFSAKAVATGAATTFFSFFLFVGRKKGWPVTESQAQLVRTACELNMLQLLAPGGGPKATQGHRISGRRHPPSQYSGMRPGRIPLQSKCERSPQ